MTEYQRITDLLDNEVTQPPKIRTKNWVERNYDVHGTYNTSSQIKLRLTC